jgi:hypothetical protein
MIRRSNKTIKDLYNIVAKDPLRIELNYPFSNSKYAFDTKIMNIEINDDLDSDDDQLTIYVKQREPFN